MTNVCFWDMLIQIWNSGRNRSVLLYYKLQDVGSHSFTCQASYGPGAVSQTETVVVTGQPGTECRYGRLAVCVWAGEGGKGGGGEGERVSNISPEVLHDVSSYVPADGNENEHCFNALTLGTIHAYCLFNLSSK